MNLIFGLESIMDGSLKNLGCKGWDDEQFLDHLWQCRFCKHNKSDHQHKAVWFLYLKQHEMALISATKASIPDESEIVISAFVESKDCRLVQ